MGQTEQIRKKNRRRSIVWLHGLLAAFIGGAATAISGMVIAPDTFNFGAPRKLLELTLAAGIINAAMYLKQSPLPEIAQAVTEVVEVKEVYTPKGAVSERQTTSTTSTSVISTAPPEPAAPETPVSPPPHPH